MVGSDDDFIYFVAPSWSRSKVDHDLSICKRTGIVLCSCEDASFRRKEPDLLDLLKGREVEQCRHQKGLVIAYRRILEAAL